MKSTDIDSIMKAERALARAHLSMDLATIDALLHADYVIVQPGGKIETKADVVDSYRTGSRHWDIAEVDELDVKIYGEMARVIGRWRAVGSNNGQAFDYQARYISIWIRESESWKNLSYSSAELTY